MPAKKTTTAKIPAKTPATKKKTVAKVATTTKKTEPKKIAVTKKAEPKVAEPKIIESKAKKTAAPAAPVAQKEPKEMVTQLPLHDLGSLKSTAEKAEKVEKAAKTTPTLAKGQMYYATGKRKTSIARTRLISNGSGIVTINNRSLEDYIPLAAKRESVKAPLRITGNNNKFDISIKVSGGGVSSQADAMRHGVAKALLEFDPALRLSLKRAGFLTRDPRMKERKKYGLHRARRAPQWSKR